MKRPGSPGSPVSSISPQSTPPSSPVANNNAFLAGNPMLDQYKKIVQLVRNALLAEKRYKNNTRYYKRLENKINKSFAAQEALKKFSEKDQEIILQLAQQNLNLSGGKSRKQRRSATSKTRRRR